MRNPLADVLPDLLKLPVFGPGSTGLPLAGTYIKQFAFVIFEQGNVEIVVWAVMMGAVALYLTYNVDTDKVCPKPRNVRVTLA